MSWQKVYDTIGHHSLLSKLEKYAVRELVLDWISSYLSNRKQFVPFGSACSQQELITCCVMQASILGSLLFTFYINELPNASNVVNTLLFAHNTNLFYSHELGCQSNYNCHESWISQDNELAQRLKLSINIVKTNSQFFPPKQKNYC